MLIPPPPPFVQALRVVVGCISLPTATMKDVYESADTFSKLSRGLGRKRHQTLKQYAAALKKHCKGLARTCPQHDPSPAPSLRCSSDGYFVPMNDDEEPPHSPASSSEASSPIVGAPHSDCSAPPPSCLDSGGTGRGDDLLRHARESQELRVLAHLCLSCMTKAEQASQAAATTSILELIIDDSASADPSPAVIQSFLSEASRRLRESSSSSPCDSAPRPSSCSWSSLESLRSLNRDAHLKSALSPPFFLKDTLRRAMAAEGALRRRPPRCPTDSTLLTHLLGDDDPWTHDEFHAHRDHMASILHECGFDMSLWTENLQGRSTMPLTTPQPSSDSAPPHTPLVPRALPRTGQFVRNAQWST
jgi:hypothetical protein